MYFLTFFSPAVNYSAEHDEEKNIKNLLGVIDVSLMLYVPRLNDKNLVGQHLLLSLFLKENMNGIIFLTFCWPFMVAFSGKKVEG